MQVSGFWVHVFEGFGFRVQIVRVSGLQFLRVFRFWMQVSASFQHAAHTFFSSSSLLTSQELSDTKTHSAAGHQPALTFSRLSVANRLSPPSDDLLVTLA